MKLETTKIDLKVTKSNETYFKIKAFLQAS